jgi:toxin CcdB
MAQFDLYTNPNPETSQSIPFLLDVQADFLNNLATRVVVPLYTSAALGKAATHLNPSFSIQQENLVLSTTELAGVAISSLGDRVGSLKDHRQEIIAALDFLFTGF